MCLLADPRSGFSIHFYWRTTIESLKTFIKNATRSNIADGSIIVMNNNIHQALKNGVSFQDPHLRYHDIKEVLGPTKTIWGPKAVFWRTPNRVRGEKAIQHVKLEKESNKKMTCAQAASVDGDIVSQYLLSNLSIPMVDAYKITSHAPQEEYIDDMHLGNWELYHEVNVWLNQLHALLEGGWFD